MVNEYREPSFYEEKFLKKYQKDNAKSAINLLKRYENIYGKNFFEFDEKEMFNSLIKIYSNYQKNTTGQYKSYHKKYLEMIEEDKTFHINFDYNTLINKAAKESTTNKICLDRNEFYKKLVSLENAQDAIVMALRFEGVGVDTNCTEIMNIRLSDINMNKVKLISNRIVTLPKEFIILLENNKEYAAENIKSNIDSEFLVKAKKTYNKDRNISQIANNILKYCKKYNPNFTTASITDSGIMFYLWLIEYKNGKLKKEDYVKVFKKYNVGRSNPTYYKYIYMYKKYREKYYMGSNINLQEYNDILEEISKIEVSSKEIEEIGELNSNNGLEFKVDEELGKLGEELFEKYFKQNYPQIRVIDRTLDYVGYDFDVKSEGYQKMYEVKSTRKIGKEAHFYMTIKEMKTAFENKDKYKVCILHINKNNDIENMYIVPNPIEVFGLTEYINNFLMMINQNICIPIQFKVIYKFNKIQKYKFKKTNEYL